MGVGRPGIFERLAHPENFAGKGDYWLNVYVEPQAGAGGGHRRELVVIAGCGIYEAAGFEARSVE